MPRTLPVFHAPLNGLSVIRRKITFAIGSTVTDIGRIPPYASVIGGGVHVLTASDGTTHTLDVGFRQGSSTDDPNAYATLLDLKTIGFKALDELATATNIIQTSAAIVTVQGVITGTPTAGIAYISIHYTVGPYDGQ